LAQGGGGYGGAGRDLNLRHANPREIMEYCQNTLPKLDDIFRVQMMYAPPELKPEFQRYFIELRQKNYQQSRTGAIGPFDSFFHAFTRAITSSCCVGYKDHYLQIS
jgi:hypothetical protein